MARIHAVSFCAFHALSHEGVCPKCQPVRARPRGLDTIVPIDATRQAFMQGFEKGTEALREHLATCPPPPMLICAKCAVDLGLLVSPREMIEADL